MTTVRTAAILLMSSLMSIPAVAQTASPPPLDYAVVADSFSLPAGMTFGSTSGVAINSKGHIFVLHRGPNPLMEFDANGKFVRALGDGLFDRPHGLRIDAQDNIWTTDVRSHVVYKFSPEGRILLVLGVRDTAGEMHSYGHLRLFNEPNDMAFGSQGEIFVVQGHGRGEPKVIKFDKDGNFIKAWGKKGTGPGEFDIARIRSRSTRRGCSTWRIGTISASRYSTPTASICGNPSIPGPRVACSSIQIRTSGLLTDTPDG